MSRCLLGPVRVAFHISSDVWDGRSIGMDKLNLFFWTFIAQVTPLFAIETEGSFIRVKVFSKSML